MKKRRGKVYTLDDGSKWTAMELQKHTGLSIATIRCRLCRTTDVSRVMAKAKNPAHGGYHKVYTLDDGSEWTVPAIVEKIGVTAACAGARLHKTREASRVLAPPIRVGKVNMEKLSASLKSRMCYEGRDHWLLLSRCT